ncbi:MAG: triose-phosphate isomerase [Candidatus Spechtbacterales bacterium]
MNKLLIVANWKMNPNSAREAERLSRAVHQGIRGMKNAEVVLCPPFPYLSAVNIGVSIVKLGAQDCHFEQKGAYTGAVSPAMLKDVGCEYVIIGHSERKQYFGETNEIINKKIKAAIKAGLKVVLCIGEDTRDTFDSRGHWTNELDPRLKEQLVAALMGIKKAQIQNITVAYEPVWAIGTGNAATPDDVLSAKIFIRKIISNLYNRKEADKIRVLYGGSTNRKNAALFIKEGQADGLLIGGASIDAEEFISMVKSVI